MKKIAVLALAVVILASMLITSALADGDHSNYAFGFTAYTNGTTLTYATGQWQIKQSVNEHYIEVRHTVTGNGSGAGFTNLMHGCVVVVDGLIYAGAKWQAPNGIYYACTSSLLEGGGHSVVPGGRANTKYMEQLSLSSIRLDGQFRPH